MIARSPNGQMRRRGVNAATLAALRLSRQIGEALADGLSGKRATEAARRLARLLGADAVALADCDHVLASWGRLDPTATAQILAETLDQLDTVTDPPLRAAPLIVSGDLAGGLIVAGDVTDAEITEAALLTAAAIDHADLDRSRERIAAADLRTLRAQISPHFMHNALAAISAHTRTDPERARELLSDFSDYLRYSFAATGDYATVADELQAVQTYLELQRARFDDRLDITVQVAPEVLPVAMPFLVVQPIVENAIRHGFESRTGTGHIAVRGFSEGPLCIIEVEDDGDGMDPEYAKAVLTGIRPPVTRHRPDQGELSAHAVTRHRPDQGELSAHAVTRHRPDQGELSAHAVTRHRPDQGELSAHAVTHRHPSQSELSAHSESAGGIGLANVDRRLRAVYGPEYGLLLDTAPTAGTKATIRIPRYSRGVLA